MKRLIFTLTLFALVIINANAQYTDVNQYGGHSGPGVCTPTVIDSPGLSPLSADLPAIVDGVPVSQKINFKNFNTFKQGNALITIDSLTIDSINNLPSGLVWNTDTVTNTYPNQGLGCIVVSGTTNAEPGQYLLNIYVTVGTNIGAFGTYASAVGLNYFVRVICGDSVPTRPLDTTGEYNNSIAAFIAYTNPCSTTDSFGVGIKTIDQNIQLLTVFPNPFSNHTTVSFNSIKAGMMTEKITTIIGTEVYRNQLDVVAGENSHQINRSNLAAGVYFYTLSDGVSTFTKRLVIAE